jgi:hypothetical protein
MIKGDLMKILKFDNNTFYKLKLDSEYKTFSKKNFLIDKISEISKSFQGPILDHKHHARDFFKKIRNNTLFFKRVTTLGWDIMYKACRLQYSFSKKNENFRYDSDVFLSDLYLFKFIDIFCLEAVASNFIFNVVTRSYNVLLDFGLKHYLKVPLNNFFNFGLKGDLFFECKYLFGDSYGLGSSFVFSYLDFDYFFSFVGINKYDDRALLCLFFKNVFLRKFKSVFFNLDLFVSTYVDDIRVKNINTLFLSRPSLSLGFVFANDYWFSSCLNLKNELLDFFFFKRFLFGLSNYYKSDLFLDIFVSSNFEFCSLKRFILFYLSSSLDLVFFFNYDFDFSWIFVGINYFCIEIFFVLFFLFLSSCFFFVKIKKNSFRYFSFRGEFVSFFNKIATVEPLWVFKKRRNESAFWQRNLMFRRTGFVFGLNKYFFFPSVLDDWNFMNNYYKRNVYWNVGIFLDSVSFFFSFYFNRYFTLTLNGLTNGVILNILFNARSFLNFCCFSRYLNNFDFGYLRSNFMLFNNNDIFLRRLYKSKFSKWLKKKGIIL